MVEGESKRGADRRQGLGRGRHACFDALAAQVRLQLRRGAAHRDHGLTKGARGIALSLHAARQAIPYPYQHTATRAVPGGPQEGWQLRPAGGAARGAQSGVRGDDRQPGAGGKGVPAVALEGRILLRRRDADGEGGARRSSAVSFRLVYVPLGFHGPPVIAVHTRNVCCQGAYPACADRGGWYPSMAVLRRPIAWRAGRGLSTWDRGDRCCTCNLRRTGCSRCNTACAPLITALGLSSCVA